MLNLKKTGRSPPAGLRAHYPVAPGCPALSAGSVTAETAPNAITECAHSICVISAFTRADDLAAAMAAALRTRAIKYSSHPGRGVSKGSNGRLIAPYNRLIPGNILTGPTKSC